MCHLRWYLGYFEVRMLYKFFCVAVELTEATKNASIIRTTSTHIYIYLCHWDQEINDECSAGHNMKVKQVQFLFACCNRQNIQIRSFQFYCLFSVHSFSQNLSRKQNIQVKKKTYHELSCYSGF